LKKEKDIYKEEGEKGGGGRKAIRKEELYI
jgi:hypothetical protein